MVIYMRPSISFIHAADLHLDSPFKGLTDLPADIFKDVRESTFRALDQLVHTAITKQVDFILLVGDLFDNEKQSLKAQVELRGAFQTLQHHQIDVFLSYGNHDFVLGNQYQFTFPENVHIFPSERVTHFIYEKNTEKLAAIYGFSYHQRAVEQNKTSEYNIVSKQIPFHIATLHGSLNGNQEHDPYAPFTLQQLEERNFDYWALGHIHQRAVLAENPPIIYPGNTQGRHRKETGEKGCYYVEMTPTETHYEFISVESIQFSKCCLDISECSTVDQLEEILFTIHEQTNVKKLIHLTLNSKEIQLHAFNEDGIIQELIDIVNETMMDQTYWQYIYTYRIETTEHKAITVEESFLHEINNALEEMDTTRILADLYQHPGARKYLDEENTNTLKEAARQLLLYDLLQMEESDN